MSAKVCLTFLVMMLVEVSLTSNLQQTGVKGEKVLSRRKRFIIFPLGSSFSTAACMTVGVYGNPQFSIFSWALNYGFAYNLPSNSSYFTHIPEGVFNLPFFDPDLGGSSGEKVVETTTPKDEELPEQPDYHDHDHQHDSSLPSATADSSRRQYHVYYQPKYETRPMIQRRYRREIYRNLESVIDKMGYHGRDCILQALCESPQVFNMKRRTMVQELVKTVFSFPKSKVLPFEHPELLIYDDAHRKGRGKSDCVGSFSKCGFSLIKMALGKYSKPQSS